MVDSVRFRGPTVAGIAVLGTLMAAGGAAADSRSGDFDGDGFDDLAVGIQGEVVGADAGAGAGAVHVIYGGRNGLSRRDRIFTRATRGVKGPPGQDGFGSALAAGDFDGDGFDDLAAGAPFDTTVLPNTGSVQIFYGGRNGLSARGDQLLVHGRGGFGPAPGDYDGLGWTLAAGNLVGDRSDDLAVTTFNGRAGGVDNAGYVEVLPGSAAGLRTANARRFSEASRGLSDTPESDDRFGLALAIGDVAKSRHDDLAIGVPAETFGGGATSAGAVHVLFGSRRGIRGRGSQYLDQGVLYGDGIGVDGTPEVQDFFGAALTIGRLYDEGPKLTLAIGAPGEDITDESPTPTADSGLVSIVHGRRGGLQTGSGLVGGLTEPIASNDWTVGARFGYSLATADIGRNRLEELIIGSPWSDGAQPQAGAVGIVYGGGVGYDSIQQGVDDIDNFGGNGDLFGFALTAGRFGGGVRSDLAIGVPVESYLPPGAGRGRVPRGSPVPIRPGAVAVVRGGAAGISRTGERLLFQGEDGLAGVAEQSDRFGTALAGPESGPTSD